MHRLDAQFDRAIAATVDAYVRKHGLDPHAAEQILQRNAEAVRFQYGFPIARPEEMNRRYGTNIDAD